MGAVVTFSYAAWVAKFPEFANVSEPTATGFFTMAEALHSNLSTGIVQNEAVQAQLMDLVTAHIAAQFTVPGGGPSPANGAVGPIASASEGSVSLSIAVGQMSQSEAAAFWNMTKYGALYWRMTSPYRSARYVPRYGTTGGVPPWA